MKIYTSYYGMVKYIPSHIVPISIALKTPPWYEGLVYKPLAPTPSILKQYKDNPSTIVYTERYTKEILDNLNLKKVLSELEELSEGHDIVLICYEKPDKPCHRHIVSKWLRSNHIDCKEITL